MAGRVKRPVPLELIARLTEDQKECLLRMSSESPVYFSLREEGPVLSLIALGLCNKLINGLHREGYGLKAILTPAGMELAASLAAAEGGGAESQA